MARSPARRRARKAVPAALPSAPVAALAAHAFPPAELLTIADVQAILRIGRSLVYQLIKTGKLEGVRLTDDMTRVTRRSVDVLIARSMSRAPQETRPVARRIVVAKGVGDEAP